MSQRRFIPRNHQIQKEQKMREKELLASDSTFSKTADQGQRHGHIVPSSPTHSLTTPSLIHVLGT